jgi:UDP-N-acetylmuramyl pentapeptide phosphotransferase/UDP-N-acetylglucosamine-1-phosphate transferase
VTAALAASLGLVLSLVLWPVLRSLFARPVFRRTNYRGRDVATAGGLVLIASVVLAEPILSAIGRYGDIAVADRDARRAVVAAVVGFGLLGLLDDLAGEGTTTGYRGHLGALLRGDVTTGVLKIVGGGIVALAVTAMAVDDRGLAWILLDAALVALTANLANLLDRRPGRTGKVTIAAGLVVCVAAGLDPSVAGVALVTGAAAGLLLPDLREDLMIGDTGANPMGAAIGLGVVVAFGPVVRVAVLVLVLLLNVASERVSFTAVIERTPTLRRLDELGRHR